jgi:hypothetical protein
MTTRPVFRGAVITARARRPQASMRYALSYRSPSVRYRVPSQIVEQERTPRTMRNPLNERCGRRANGSGECAARVPRSTLQPAAMRSANSGGASARVPRRRSLEPGFSEAFITRVRPIRGRHRELSSPTAPHIFLNSTMHNGISTALAATQWEMHHTATESRDSRSTGLRISMPRHSTARCGCQRYPMICVMSHSARSDRHYQGRRMLTPLTERC